MPRSNLWRSPASKSDLVLAILFTLSIGLPGTLQLAGLAQSTPQDEQRSLAALPAFPIATDRWRSFAAELNAYLADRIGLRPAMVEAGHRLRSLLRLPASDLALVGQDGWLFYAGAQEVEQHTGLRLLSAAEISQWLDSLAIMHRELAARGIRFVFVIAPDKSTIYPEKLPRGINLAERMPADQLMAALAMQQPGVDVVDLRPVLQMAKSSGELYYRTDTHWNGIGAYVGLKAVVDGRWPDGIRLPPLSDYKVDNEPMTGDLEKMAQLNCCTSEPHVRLVPAPGTVLQYSDAGQASALVETRLESPRQNYPYILIFGDSFDVGWEPLLPDVVHRAVFIHNGQPFPLAFIEREKPAIVIYETVQRYLINPPTVAR